MFYKHIAESLINNGYETYLVGGALRDELLGKIPHDYDLMIKGTIEDLKKLPTIINATIVPTGLDYGIVKAINPETKEEVDISVPRLDLNYDGRRPTLVKEASTIEEDLARRDFTINALARNMKTGKLIDLFGGAADLKNKILRCVGNAQFRFEEDGLRILRAIRFVYTLGLTFDSDLVNGVFCRGAQEALQTRVSNERFRDELCRMAEEIENGIDFMKAILKLDLFRALEPFVPELLLLKKVEQNIHHDHDVWIHTMTALEHTKPDLIVRMAVLFHDIGKPNTQGWKNKEYGHTFYDHHIVGAKMAEEILNRIAFGGYVNNSSLDVKRIKRLIWNHLSFNQIKVAKLLRYLDIERFGTSIIDQLHQVMLADIQGRNYVKPERLEAVTKKRDDLYEALNRTDAPNRKKLQVNGNDLTNIGLKPGPEYKDILNILWEDVIDGKVENDRQQLLHKLYLLKIEGKI